MRNSTDPNYYSSLAKEVYAVGRREKWDEKKIKEMLKDPTRFEKYWQKVSSHFLRHDFRAKHSNRKKKTSPKCPT